MSNPLWDGPPSEIRLSAAPLVRVLCAVRFSPIMKIVDPSGAGVAEFQERIRAKYPSLSQEQEHAVQFEVGEPGVAPAPMVIAQPVWRFMDKTQGWRVSLTREVLGLETKAAYVDRSDFLGRLNELCAALEGSYQPSQCLRLGVRYVNSLSEDYVDRLTEFVQPDYLAFGHDIFLDNLTFSHSHCVFKVPEGQLITHFGILGPMQVHDPQVMEPVDARRYFLDMDAFSDAAFDFAAAHIEATARRLTERVYTVFRSAVTSKLLESCNAA